MQSLIGCGDPKMRARAFGARPPGFPSAVAANIVVQQTNSHFHLISVCVAAEAHPDFERIVSQRERVVVVVVVRVSSWRACMCVRVEIRW